MTRCDYKEAGWSIGTPITKDPKENSQKQEARQRLQN